MIKSSWCLLSGIALPVILACGSDTRQNASRSDRPEGAIFIESADELGIDFLHQSGASGRLYMPETTGSGVAVTDYDGDGDLDLYLVQGGALELGASTTQALVGDRLFRNDLGADAAWRFVDVTSAAGVEALRYGQGVAVGDVDGDRDTDFFLANFGADELWLNNGDGTFHNATEAAGLGDDGWAASALFFDYDRDNRLDLFVTRYLQYSLASHKDCYFTTGSPDYCKPGSYSPMTDLLYRNQGDGRFQPILDGEIVRRRASGLGAVTADLDDDGWLDLYVANDQMPNFLWLNRSAKGFAEAALIAGVALNSAGMAEASMGVVAADLDRDGRRDLFMTHLDGETNTYFRNLGDGLFEDQTRRFDLASPSVARTSFGVAALDFDLDGWLDLATANGAVHIDYDQQAAGAPLPLAQPDQLFENLGEGFSDVSSRAGAEKAQPAVGRGLANGDLDNDGRPDFVVNNAHGPSRVFLNADHQSANWIGFEIVHDGTTTEDGCRIEVELASPDRLVGWFGRDGSYLSSNDPRVLFGLDDYREPIASTLTCPDGRSLRWSGLEPNRYYRLQR